MKITVTEDLFIDQFRVYGRSNQFSRNALSALWDLLTELELDTGEERELDVIAICCDWSEDSIENVIRENGIEIDPELGDVHDQVEEYIRDRTMVAYCDSETICYLSF